MMGVLEDVAVPVVVVLVVVVVEDTLVLLLSFSPLWFILCGIVEMLKTKGYTEYNQDLIYSKICNFTQKSTTY